MYIMLNGEMMSECEASVPILDHGLLYGVGAFETLRTYDGHAFLFDDHMVRFRQACETMRIQLSFSPSEWEGKIKQVLRANSLRGAIIRITVTGGVKEIGLQDVNYTKPNWMVFARPLPGPKRKGKRLQVVSTVRQAPGGVETLKTNNYLNNIIARHEIEDYPSTEGLTLSPEGYVAEGITSNLFFVKDGDLFTPSIEVGILPGITRGFVMHLAEHLGYKVYEGNYTLAHLREAEEIFLTNAVQEITPVLEFEGSMLKEIVTNHLIQEYCKYTHDLKSRYNLK